MSALVSKASGATSSGSGGGGLGYSGSNQSSVSTPVTTTAGGGVNQNFNLGSLGIGNTTQSVPPWVWYVAAGVAVLFAWRMLKR